MTARIEHLETSGTFSLDGGTWEVDNNVWLVGDDDEVVLIDAPHDAAPILSAIGDRRLVAVVCTHGHDDHITVAPEIAEATGAPVLLHSADGHLWQATHAGQEFQALSDGDVPEVAGTQLRALHTPGHAPGAVCLYAPELGVVFTGDTLFAGGPGATGRSYSDFDTIIASIRDRLFPLPDDTRVHTGHGASTTIGEERPHLDEWIARGS